MTIQSTKTSKNNELNLQRVQKLWDRSSNALDTDNYNDAITALKTAVHEIEQNVLPIVLLRQAKVLATQGSFENAITDLYRVIQLAPELAEGYFYAGQVLRTMGRHDEALRIYNNGVRALSPVSSSSSSNDTEQQQQQQLSAEYLDLVQTKLALEQEIEHDNTMLWKLPLELLNRIFIEHLTFEDRLQCSFTCRAWESIILDVLPRANPKVILGDMPKRSMHRLLTTVLSSDINVSNAASTPTDDTNQPRRPRMYKIAIRPRTAPKSVQNILMALVNKEWHDRIETFEVLSGMDGVGTYVKQSFRMLLLQNKTSLRKIIICGIKDTLATKDTLGRCPNVEHLVTAAHHSLLPYNKEGGREDDDDDDDDKELDDAMPRQTYSGKKIGNYDDSWMTNIAFGRNLILSHAQTLGLQAITKSDNPAHKAEEILRNNSGAQNGRPILFTSAHANLKRLDLVGMEIFYFLDPNFWKLLPKLEHVAIKDPIDLPTDFLKIAQMLQQNCPKLKTFRYGSGWEAPKSKEERQQRRQQQQQEQATGKDGLIELFIRAGPDSKLDDINGPSLVQGMITSHSNTLTILVLELRVLRRDSGIEALARLSFPCLRELQFHAQPRQRGVHQIITEPDMTTLIKNCPVLERIVFNNVYVSKEALYALGDMQTPLRCIHLKLPDDDDHYVAAFANRFRANNNNNNNTINDNGGTNNAPNAITSNLPQGRRRTITTATTAITTNHVMQHSLTMITEACFSGEYLKDADLHTLTTCNHNCLATIRFVACKFLTADGITAGLTQAKSLRHVTFARMQQLLQDTMITDLSVELPYLEDLVFIEFNYKLSHLQAITERYLKGAEQSIAARRKSVISLKVYLLPNLAVRQTLLIERRVLVDQQQQQHQVRIKTSMVQDISIARPVLDYI